MFVGDTTGLIMAVMIFGLGGPIISAGAPKVVVSSFTGATRGFAMGIYMTGPAIGSIISLTMMHSILLPAFDQSWAFGQVLRFSPSFFGFSLQLSLVHQ